MKIRKGDKVLVISGKDKNRTGLVEKVLPKEKRLIVEGVNIVKKHVKRSKKYLQGGIIQLNQPIDISNVMLLCPHCHKPTRVGFRLLDQKKVRICKKCQEVIDNA